MTSQTDFDPNRRAPVIYQEDPVRKSAPVLEVGLLAWIRQNLFRTWLDTLLTILSIGLIVSVVTSAARWIVTEANWYVIIFNLRQFLLGRFEAAYEWRVQVAVLSFAFVAGFALATFSRASRALIIGTLITLVLVFALPVLITATVPLPPAYVLAGNIEVTSGGETKLPQPALAFTGQAGDEISLRVAEAYDADDATLATLNSFGDEATNVIRTATVNRLDTKQRIAVLETLLAGDRLTTNQRQQFTTELERLTVPDPITTTVALNTAPVLVRVLVGETGEVIGGAELQRGSDALTLTLPQDGWYVLEKTVPEGASAVTLLAAEGIYPLLERNLTVAGADAASTRTITQYVRMTDEFTVETARPQVAGENVPLALITNNRYRGDGTFPDYLRLYLAPFLNQINVAFGLIALFAAVGYFASVLIERLLPDTERPKGRSNRIVFWLLIAWPLIGFVLIYGTGGVLPLTDTRRWGGLLLTIFLSISGIVLSFPLGVLLALGRRSTLPVISQSCTLYIEFVRGVPLITVLFMSQLLVPLINPGLADFPNVFRAMVGITLFSAAYLAENVRGGLQSIPRGQIEAAKALSLSPAQISLYITLPQALRAVIPALVGQFISLFKDTSLVAIVGLIDLTGIAETVYAQTEFIGLRRETLLFVTLIYFVFSYSIAAVSRQIERSGSGATRRQQL